ncbi:hypothetical protein [Protaetiibacter intestinalis]|uniref:Lipoprotein n=1 Tax=Protaetiibacter intestinalis TaxID=2419774 RepID=A0A387BFD2_9MICO|nr:hypothetical protein [Protaetiibacter intestinalis]AYF97200.1 hypothetical protein D7I47_02340 [Protaetiibacter intestinalis]
MVSIRSLGAACLAVFVVATLVGCASAGEAAATARARSEFAEMKEQFIANAPAANTEDSFVQYVHDHRLDTEGELAIDPNGDPDLLHVGVGGRSTRLIYSARVLDGAGVVSVIVMGYDSPAGWGTRPETVYSCLTATFDLERGGEPAYADTDCVKELNGATATDRHKTVGELGG